MTKTQIRNRTKTVTRRLGWRNIKLHTPHQAIEKGQGLKRGEKIVVMDTIIPITSYWEPLQALLDSPAYGAQEVIKEGFPDLAPDAFVYMMCKKHKCGPEREFNRIEFRYQ